MSKKSVVLIIAVLFLWSNGCARSKIIIGPHNSTPLPTPASTIPDLVTSLSDPDYQVRLAAIYALHDKGPNAAEAVPALIDALSDDVSEIRAAAADALGEIGPQAFLAVPALIEILKYDDYIHARVYSAEALGKIGDVGAVPTLAEMLWDQVAYDTHNLPIKSAWALAQLTKNPFPDSESGVHGYQTNDQGVPLIVIAAREWWEREGKYKKWSTEP